MSTYGLKTFDAAGNPLITITDKLNRHRYAAEVAANASGSEVLSDIDGFTTVQLAVAVNPSTFYKIGHQVTRSGTTISWQPPSYANYSSDSLILVFYYV